MYSLHDITTVCPKLEPVSDEGECNEEEQSNHSDSNTDTVSEQFPINNNTIQIKVSEYKFTANGDKSIHEGTTTNGEASYDNISTSQSGDLLTDKTSTTDTTARHVEMPQGQIMNAYTTAPLYENGGYEAVYYSVSTADTGTGGQEIYANETDTYQIMIPQQNGAPEGLPRYQSSIYRTLPYVPVASKEQFSPYQRIALYSGTHRPLTAREMAIQTKPCCNCPCHVPDSSHQPVFSFKTQRPSVIMVPSDKSDASLDATPKLESTAYRLMTENAIVRRDLQHNGYNEVVDSDSSDEDEDGKEEKYFRVNIDGTTARFKLTKEDWERIPINTFPSGGRLLSGDWTRIFLEKVKESNPWCSLRFKNNHVRSENSRKIHSAVFFRGGAECKRPECNVKVRFVIRKEKGKHVDVTYVGNVCHSSEPGGSDVGNEKKTKQVRRMRKPYGLHE